MVLERNIIYGVRTYLSIVEATWKANYREG